MTLVSNIFQGTDGVNVTAAISGGTSGDVYQVVSPTNTDAVEYFAYHNPIANAESVGKIDAALNAATGIGEVRFVQGNAIAGAQQLVVKFNGAPTGSTCVLMQIRGTIQNGDLRVSTSGVIHASLQDGSLGLTGGTAIDMSASSPWYVIDFWLQEGTTTTNGRAKFRIRALNNLSTVLHSAESSTRNTGVQGTHTITDWRMGKFTQASSMPAFYIAQHRADDGATDYISDPVQGALTLTDVEPWSTVTLNGTGSSSWQQVSGPAVTLGGSGDVRTFTAPASMSTTTLSFTYGGDTTTISVLPATEAVYTGGQWTPIRFIRKL